MLRSGDSFHPCRILYPFDTKRIAAPGCHGINGKIASRVGKESCLPTDFCGFVFIRGVRSQYTVFQMKKRKDTAQRDIVIKEGIFLPRISFRLFST